MPGVQLEDNTLLGIFDVAKWRSPRPDGYEFGVMNAQLRGVQNDKLGNAVNKK